MRAWNTAWISSLIRGGWSVAIYEWDWKKKSILILLTMQHCGESKKNKIKTQLETRGNYLRATLNKIWKILVWLYIILPCTEDDVGPRKWGLMWMFLGCGGCCCWWWCWGKLGGGELIIRSGGSICGRSSGERCVTCEGMRGWRGCWASGRPCSWKEGGPLGRIGWCCWDCTGCWWRWWGGGIREDGC